MMDDTEIKYEFPLNASQCTVCLSVGRELSSLGMYQNIYSKLNPDNPIQSNLPVHEVQLCWECLATLRKACQFQRLARKANELLQLGQAHIHGTLSNLTAMTIKESFPHTVYVNMQTDIKIETHFNDTIQNNDDMIQNGDDMIQNGDDMIQNNDDMIQRNDDIMPKYDDDMLKCDEIKQKNDIVVNTSFKIKEVIEKVESKKPKSNRWAEKRASQNKKAKFKIITDYKFVNSFKKVQVDNDELQHRLARERDSECYKSMRFKCDYCAKGFNEEKMFGRHNNEFHRKGLASYICDVCKSTLPNKRTLSFHIKQHFFKYKCTLCDYLSYDKSQAKSHFQKKHRRVFQCLKCKLTFGSRRDFFKHHKDWHERFTCDHCGISFKMRYCIEDHIRKRHSPYECKRCDKRFLRYNGLWLHNATRHGAAARGAYCVECDRKYADGIRFRWHLANSVRHRPPKRLKIPCPGCDKSFTKKIYMKDHYDLVHLKHYKYRCEKCDKNFVRNADLVQHIRRVHEGVLPPRNKICYICGRGFTTNKILHNHIRTHTGERPFACSLCDARFAQSGALTAHERAIHRSTKPKREAL